MVKLKIFVTIMVLTLTVGTIIAQYKHDYTMVAGYWSEFDGYYDPVLDFNQDTMQVKYEKHGISLDIGGTNISDKNGKLALYFNGCQLADGDHNFIDDGFNPGYVYDNYCPPIGSGYTAGQQQAIILPIPEREHQYIIFHSKLRFYWAIDSFNFYKDANYSLIDLNSKPAKVIRKNIPLLADTTIGAVFTAVKHSNSIDWWVIIQDRYYTNGYYKVLVTKDTVRVVDYQNIGSNIKIGGAGGSQACFSPNGKVYATFSSDDGLNLFNFDRNSGQFSNFKKLSIQKDGFVNGCCFSPNGRFVYLTDTRFLYQVDLAEDSLVAELVAEWDGFKEPSTGIPVVFGPMQTGPDCRIYVHGRCRKYWHVIMKPDEKGKDCDVRQHFLEFKVPVCNIPHFPNFRLDTPYPYCDPNKVLITGTNDPLLLENISRTLIISPNPGYDGLSIELPYHAQLPLSIDIIDIHGLKVHTKHHDTFDAVSIDALDWASGIYSVHLRDRDGRRWSGKWVKL